MAIGAAAALPLTGAPTGLGVVDAILRAATIAAVVALIARAPVWTLLLAAAVATGGGAGRPAAVLLGATVALALAGTRSSVVRTAAATGVALCLFRLRLPYASGATTALAALAVAPALAFGVSRLPAAHRQRLRTPALGAIAAVAVFSAVAFVAVLTSRSALLGGARSATAGLSAAGRGDRLVARRDLRAASRRFRAARHRLDAWWVAPARVVPVVAPQLRTLRAVARAGSDLTSTAAAMGDSVDIDRVRLTRGAVDVDRLAALVPPLDRAARSLSVSSRRLRRAASPWLLPPISRRFTAFVTRVGRAETAVTDAALAAREAPALLGAQGPRRYFLAIQTPTELRGSGGFIGSWGVIEADHGHLRLTHLGRTGDLNSATEPKSRRLVASKDFTDRYTRFHPEQLWQNVTASPDFPSDAALIANLYPQSGGEPVDGVIAIDPYGLAALLRLIGPIEVAGWPEPLTPDNAPRILLYDQYVRLEGQKRVDFLGDAAGAVWRGLTTQDLPGPAGLAGALGPAVRAKRILLWSAHPAEQALFAALHADGALAPVRGDFLGIVTHNANPSKIDWFLRRAVTYDVSLQPRTHALRARMTITLHNDAPGGGLPAYLIGNLADHPTPLGTNSLYLSIYTPWLLDRVTNDGTAVAMDSEHEKGRRVYSMDVSIPPGATVTVVVDLHGRLASADAYHLDVHRQPAVAPDDLALRLHTPRGWRADFRDAPSTVVLDGDARFDARLRPTSSIAG